MVRALLYTRLKAWLVDHAGGRPPTPARGSQINHPTIGQRPGGGVMLEFGKRFIRDESGQDMAEYGLLLALIGVGLVATIGVLRGSIKGAFDKADAALNTPTP
jgi:Flp pilus assembly pilin Flp